jgi:membrane associated rhomboid family serine protease
MAENETRLELAIPSPGKLFTPAVTVLLALMIIGYAITNYAREFTCANLALSAEGILSGKIWQLLTYPFVEGNGLTLIFFIFILLFVGSNIEKEYRAGWVVLFLSVISVFCGIIWFLVTWLIGINALGHGGWGCGFGLSTAFGMLFYKRRYIAWFWVMEGQYVAWALIAIGIIFCIPSVITLLWLSGAVIGYLYIKLRYKILFAAPSMGQRNRPKDFIDID